MSCVKSYTYPINADNGGNGALPFFGLFFGPGQGDTSGGNVKYYITIKIRGSDGEYKPVKVVADTGNDITLLTKQVADYLGFNPAVGALLEVSGIREGMVSRFKKIVTYIQLGDLMPVTAEVGFALDNDSLQENLLGNKGILSSGKFEFRYTKNALTIIDNVNTCGSTSGMDLAKSQYASRHYGPRF